ncbi:peptide chain release factor N(5)-glutamine methyltransferase [Nocardioides humilatus]|uniref:Release factor glutamine methyltransferase n=1 Tax=Nocardioides humilatus TaxID=2607660 RepID=A0A5B1LMI1_9ACTN|nr:peptide chain release factor N(5)-glutamine methyltransferase [Nocardioides humilatus]KAA1420847.1 peptide chain release factor N(5)-glutamine methyltransferase [Nocardioides humilatus]
MNLRAAIEALREAGVASPDHDARELLAHLTGSSRLLLADPTPEQAAEFGRLIARRAAREPLQHLTGMAYFRHVELRVGPGVFVPRPETELLAGWAIDRARELEAPVVVDLCTGSGAVAAAVRDEAPHAEVHAVELSADAFAYAESNLTGVDLRLGDAFVEFDDLVGAVDIVVCNPPYVPLEAWESVAVEARDHDPHLALFSGDDGLDAIRVLAARAARLLKPGGVIGVEHADAQGESAPAVFAAQGSWEEVRDHRDLNDRPRFLTARRTLRGSPTGE